ncbi:MAG: hypothetical protein E6I86_13730 [Chloroflexi bacterium]|nr:MAG: hypothetical protein E6I86_13730 [Chloroflexota bacterium]
MSLPAPFLRPDSGAFKPTPARAWLVRITTPAALLALYGLLALGLFAATWASPVSHVIGDGPDPPVFIWYLRWVPFAISHGLNPLFTSYLDFPDGINLMWQTSVPLLGLLLAPITLTLGPIFSYNLLMTASMALAAWCAFLAFRRHVARPWAAALGGLLFGFSPYMLAQSLGHPHVGVVFICPLMLIAFEEAVLRQQRSPGGLGAIIGLLAAAQMLISEEMLLTQVLLACMALAILAGLRPDQVRIRAAHVLKVLGVAAGMLTLVAVWPLWMQFLGPQAVHGTLAASNVFVTDVAGLVLPTSLQAIAPPALTAVTDRFSGSQYEAGAFLGLPLLALLVFTAVRWWRVPAVQVASMLALLAACLSLGVTLHLGGVTTGIPAGLLALAFLAVGRTRVGRVTPVIFGLVWAGLATVPLLHNVVPSRLMLYVFLFASLLLSVLVDRWDFASPRRTMAAGAIAVLALLTLLPRIPFATSPANVPAFFSAGAVSTLPTNSIVLVVPYAHELESRAMLWQLSADLRFKMPEGYANRPGPALDPAPTMLGHDLMAMQQGAPAPEVSTAYRTAALAELRRWQVQAVVLGPMAGEGRVVEFLTAIMGTPPTQDGGVYLWRLGPS